MNEIAYDHYKETYAVILNNYKDRERYFCLSILLLLVGLINMISPEKTAELVNGFSFGDYKISMSLNFKIIYTLIWVIIFYVTMRYFQINFYLNKLYPYISELEIKINRVTKGNFINREGKNYNDNYPVFSDWVDLIYTKLIPFSYLCIGLVKITLDWKHKEVMGYYLFANIGIAVMFIITVCLYVVSYEQNKSQVKKATKRVK